jgi:hypothetical protein
MRFEQMKTGVFTCRRCGSLIKWDSRTATYIKSVELNPEQTQLWENCYFDNPPGDLWLINLFANEHYYLKNGQIDNSRLVTDFNC